MSSSISRAIQFLRLPFAILWRALLVRLPWLVPYPVLYITSPSGPQPYIYNLRSRRDHLIPIWIFLPPDVPAGGSIPVHIDFHGGGFIMGNPMEQAPFCAQVAREAGRIVLSVDYRMGPIDQFPAAVEDAEDVLSAVLNGNGVAGKELRDAINRFLKTGTRRQRQIIMDPARLSISGFSSGGNLALNLATNVPELDWPSLLPSQLNSLTLLLFYPSFDSRLLPNERRLLGKPQSPSLFSSLFANLGPTYLPADKRDHPRACPGLIHSNNIHRQAKIFLLLPEIDTLAEQSEEWIKRMEQEKRSECLSVVKVPGMVHGWTQFPDYWISEKARMEKKMAIGRSIEFLTGNS